MDAAGRLLPLRNGLFDGCCDVGHRPEQNQRVVLGRKKSATAPKVSCIWVHCVHNQPFRCVHTSNGVLFGNDVSLHVILPGHNADGAMHSQAITLMSPA